MQKRNLRGGSLNDVNIQGQVNTRRSLPTRHFGRFGRYSAKHKYNMGSKFVPNDLMIEMDEVFSNFRQMFSNDKEVDNVLKNLKEVEDKYLNHFPEEKLEIKKFIRIKYGAYDSFIRKTTIGMFRPFEQDIARAKKELRDAIYHGEPVSKKNEIINKYINDIGSRFSYQHLPLLRLSLELFIQFKKYSAKDKVNGSNFVPSHRTTKHHSASKPTVAIEPNDVIGNMNKVPTKDTYHYADLMLEMDNVLFEYNEQGRRRVKVINDETDDFAYLFKLKEIRDKYLSAFPEEKEIKRDISIIYEILCKQVETRDTSFGNEIIEAKKELRDAFYGRYDNQTFFTKKDEIIDKYEKDIQSRITSVDENPHILLILELYYNSLAFSYRSLRTTNNVQLRAERRLLLETAQKNQLRIASKSKGVDGKMELTNANKQRVDSRKSAF